MTGSYRLQLFFLQTPPPRKLDQLPCTCITVLLLIRLSVDSEVFFSVAVQPSSSSRSQGRGCGQSQDRDRYSDSIGHNRNQGHDEGFSASTKNLARRNAASCPRSRRLRPIPKTWLLARDPSIDAPTRSLLQQVGGHRGQSASPRLVPSPPQRHRPPTRPLYHRPRTRSRMAPCVFPALLHGPRIHLGG